MNTPSSQTVVKRFFEAMDMLKERKSIRGYKTFCDRYQINRQNLWNLQQHPEKGYFQVAWLSALVDDYGFNAEWLLTGKGDALKEQATVCQV